ncbi:response regulator transcription factor [Bdellovibrionota bacterium FG-2]
MAQILVVEDALDIQKTVQGTLREHTIVLAGSLADAKTRLKGTHFDLMLLDVTLPDGDGFEFFSKLDEFTAERVPVVFLTSKTDVTDKVLGFSMGADDYITKPFEPLELKARVESHLRRTEESRQKETVITLGGLTVDLRSQRATMKTGNKDVSMDLTPVEFRLLLFFCKRVDQVISREQVLAAVWGHEIHVSDRVVDTHVSHLRKKLLGGSCAVEPVYGMGYRFVMNERP